jgi:hypothetical protein
VYQDSLPAGSYDWWGSGYHFYHYVHFIADPYTPFPGPGISWDGGLNDGYHYANVYATVHNSGTAGLELGLDSWGGVRDDWYFRVGSNRVGLGSNDQLPISSFTGYNQYFGTLAGWRNTIVKEYPRKRILANVEWAADKWNVDRNMIMQRGYEGLWCFTHPDIFCDVRAAGVADPGFKDPALTHQDPWGWPKSRWGEENWRLRIEGQTLTAWDWFDLSHPFHTQWAREMPFVEMKTAGAGHDWKGSCDRSWGGIPKLFHAMEENRQMLVLIWKGSCGSTSQESSWSTSAPVTPLNKSFPAFTSNSTNHDVGDSLWISASQCLGGDLAGQTNAYATWDVNSIIDEMDRWSVVASVSGGPSSMDVDITPRRLQNFTVNGCDTFAWTCERNSAIVQQDTVVAEDSGLVTAVGINIQGSTKITFQAIGRTSDQGCSLLETVKNNGNMMPKARFACVPNPFTPVTTVVYTLPSDAVNKTRIRLMVYDMSGRLVRTLADNTFSTPVIHVEWDGRDDRGRELCTGIFAIRAVCGSRIQTSKAILVK